MMIKLKRQYSGHLMQRVDSLEKTLMLGGIGGRRTEDEVVGWHHWLDWRESEWTPGIGGGQGGLACCNSWGRRESDTTERMNWTELNLKVPGAKDKDQLLIFFFLFIPQMTRNLLLWKNNFTEKKSEWLECIRIQAPVPFLTSYMILHCLMLGILIY